MELGIHASLDTGPGLPRARTADHSLATRLAWITGLRLAFLLLLFGATARLYLGGELARYPFSLRITFATITAGFVLAAVYAAVAAWIGRPCRRRDRSAVGLRAG